MGLTFGYDLIDSDETRAIYTQMLEDDRIKFMVWRSARDGRQYLPIDGAFSTWWFVKGPTAFASGTDAVRYKLELLAFVRKSLEEKNEQG